MRFRGFEKDLCRRLGQHGLRIFSIALLKLATALEAEHNRVARLASFCDRRMKLWQLVETGEFIENEPYRFTLQLCQAMSQLQGSSTRPIFCRRIHQR